LIFIYDIEIMKYNKDDICVEWMSQILKKTQDNVFVYDLEWICAYTNSHLASILGFDPVWKDLNEIFPHRSQEHIKKILMDYKNIRETQKWDVISIQKEKVANWEERIFSVTREPITWMWNPAIAWIGKDITELFLAKEEVEKANEEIKTTNEELLAINDELNEKNKQLEMAKRELENANIQLQNVNDQLNQFMSYVIHDIKNPVNAINWFWEIMKQYITDVYESKNFTKDDFEKIIFFLDIVKQSSDRVYAFVEDLNEFWALKKWVTKSKINKIATKDFFDKILNQQHGYLTHINELSKKEWKKEKDINFVLNNDLISFPKIFESDEKLLERIFTNLISNAIKFTDTWTISISAEQNNGCFVFSVSDTWSWIDKENYEKIFQEFQSLESDCQPIIRWSWLWLAIVLKIINVFWGKMLPIQSELGKGSTFSFEIPIINN